MDELYNNTFFWKDLKSLLGPVLVMAIAGCPIFLFVGQLAYYLSLLVTSVCMVVYIVRLLRLKEYEHGFRAAAEIYIFGILAAVAASAMSSHAAVVSAVLLIVGVAFFLASDVFFGRSVAVVIAEADSALTVKWLVWRTAVIVTAILGTLLSLIGTLKHPYSYHFAGGMLNVVINWPVMLLINANQILRFFIQLAQAVLIYMTYESMRHYTMRLEAEGAYDEGADDAYDGNDGTYDDADGTYDGGSEYAYHEDYDGYEGTDDEYESIENTYENPEQDAYESNAVSYDERGDKA